MSFSDNVDYVNLRFIRVDFNNCKVIPRPERDNQKACAAGCVSKRRREEDILVIETLPEGKIDHAEHVGPFIAHFDEKAL